MSIHNEIAQNPLSAVTAHKLAGIREDSTLANKLMELGRNRKITRPTNDSRCCDLPLIIELGTSDVGGGLTKLLVKAPPHGSGDTRARYLPYNEDVVWITQLGSSAEVFVTAELTGCDVYVFGDPASPWVCHANRNANASESASTSSLAKRRMAEAAVRAKGGDTTLLGSFEGANYRSKKYDAAFVLGNRKNNRWTFFSFLKMGTGYEADVLNP